MKTITTIQLMLFVSLMTFGQINPKPTIYKQTNWVNIKDNGGDLFKAADHPIREKVKIIRTDKSIEVNFGEKKFTYQIVSKNNFSDFKTDYKVLLNKTPYSLSISVMPDGTLMIEIEKEWAVLNITDIS